MEQHYNDIAQYKTHRFLDVSHLVALNAMERVAGIEPASQPWKGRIITTIRYPLDVFVAL